jgi:thiamine-phosphate pyrophosphorylase
MFGKTISSSFHELEELINCDFEFDYHLLSPVFSSISKVGYEGRGFDVNHIDKRIIGMGGVKTKNVDAFTKLGFKGVATLGGVWNSSAPLSDFKIMNNYFTQIK